MIYLKIVIRKDGNYIKNKKKRKYKKLKIRN